MTVTIPSGLSTQTTTSDGISVALTDPNAGVQFTQVYQGVCNPATQDFDTCWLFESYTSGQTGLTGSISLKITPDAAIGAFDVTWEGITDRFGDPPQWHRHGTIADYNAPLVTGGN